MRQSYVCGFVFDEESMSRVLLIRKARPEWMAGRLNGIGGKIEPGEHMYTAMMREFKEETTVHIPEANWYMFATLFARDGIVHFFRATLPWNTMAAAVNVLGDEPVGAASINVDYHQHCVPNLSYLIPMARHIPYQIGEQKAIHFQIEERY